MKSKKLLSTLVALSIVATSSIAFGSVQAAGINPGKNTQKLTYVNKNSMPSLSNYSVYSSLSYNAIRDIVEHEHEYRFSTAGELADYMVSKGYVDRTVALNTALTIVWSGYNGALEENNYPDGILFLKANNSNEYTVIPNYSLNNTTYTPYFYLSQEQVDTISNYMKTSAYLGGTFQFRDFLVNNNICSDPDIAYYVGMALRAHTAAGLEHINNNGVLIFKSNNVSWKFMAAPSPKYFSD